MSDQSEPPPAGPAATTGQPARYARTTHGLVASMIVTVVAVVVVFLLLRLDNGGAEQDPEAVDYREAVTAAEGAGIAIAYPPALPKGWIATSVDLPPGPRQQWGLGVLTDDGLFAGIRQQGGDLDGLLDTYVDEDAQQGDDVTLDSPLADTWTTWSDSGGDHAYAAEVTLGGQTENVLVYGSASEADLRTLVTSLVASGSG